MDRKKFKRILHFIGVISIAFLLLSIFVIALPPTFIDKAFSKEIQERQNPLLDKFMTGISIPGYMPYSAILVAISAALFLLFRYKKEALFVLLTGLSGAVSTFVKYIINRPRPAAPLVRVLGKNEQQSFPSGHVVFYVAFFGFMLLLMYLLTSILKTVRVSAAAICAAMILLVGVSRVYLGAHWLTDVLGGFLLGTIFLYFISYFYLKAVKKLL